MTAFLFSAFGVSPKVSAFWGSADYSKTSCKDLRGEIVHLSQSQAGQVQIIKIITPLKHQEARAKFHTKELRLLTMEAK